MTDRSQPTPPVACLLGEAEQRARAEEIRRQLVAHGAERRQLPDGVRLRFARGEQVIRDLAELIDFESRCCPFLHFALAVPPGAAAIDLTITGPPGSDRFLADAFGGAAPGPAAGPARAGRRGSSMLYAGVAGVGAAVLGLVCCATPALALLLGVVGAGAVTATLSTAIDVVALPALLAFGTLAVVGWRRRQTPTCGGRC